MKLGLTTLPEQNVELTKLERIFRAPPLTADLIAAIESIAPQYGLTANEESRAYWEADQNGSCWGEYEALAPLFEVMPRPNKFLDIGPGLGRSMVFFSKKLSWQDSEKHGYEGDGSHPKYMLMGPRFTDSFCGNIEMLQHVLKFNDINNAKIFDAGEMQLSELPGPYDFLYGFYSIGFHWALEHFLDDVLNLMHTTSVAVFTVPNEFRPFSRLESLPHKVVEWNTVWPKGGRLKLLVMGKESMPNF